MTPHRSWRPALFLAVVAGMSLAGCASAQPGPTKAAATAQAFYRAVSAAQGATACRLLAPATVEALEKDADEPCEQAILAGDVGGTLTERADDATDPTARTAGLQAQVTLASDVVFLTVSGDSWLVTAAGCDARPHRPYDCVVEGS